MSATSSDYIERLCGQLKAAPPFSRLSVGTIKRLCSDAKLVSLKPGQTLIYNRKLQDRIYLLVEGQVRLLVDRDGEIETISEKDLDNLLVGYHYYVLMRVNG